MCFHGNTAITWWNCVLQSMTATLNRYAAATVSYLFSYEKFVPHKIIQIQDVCDRFWKHLPLEIVETIEEPLGMHYVWDCDINFYSAMLNVTFGEAMAQIDPVALEQLASVATHFVGWTKQAIVGLPVSFAERKIQRMIFVDEVFLFLRTD